MPADTRNPLFQPDIEPRRRSLVARRKRRRRTGFLPVLLVVLGLIPAPLPRGTQPAGAAHAAALVPSVARHKVAGWRSVLKRLPTPAKAASRPRRKAARTHRRHLQVWATAYCPTCRVCDTGRITATGRFAFSRGVAVAARGRRAVPLGSRVYVPRFGWLRVDDTGGGVRSDQIDIRVATHRRAVLWGRRLIQVSLDR